MPRDKSKMTTDEVFNAVEGLTIVLHQENIRQAYQDDWFEPFENRPMRLEGVNGLVSETFRSIGIEQISIDDDNIRIMEQYFSHIYFTRSLQQWMSKHRENAKQKRRYECPELQPSITVVIRDGIAMIVNQ